MFGGIKVTNINRSFSRKEKELLSGQIPVSPCRTCSSYKRGVSCRCPKLMRHQELMEYMYKTPEMVSYAEALSDLRVDYGNLELAKNLWQSRVSCLPRQLQGFAKKAKEER